MKLPHDSTDAKGKKIFYAQIIFLIGLIFIPILLGFLIHAYFINAIASDVKEDKEQKSNQTSKKEVDERLKDNQSLFKFKVQQDISYIKKVFDKSGLY